MKIFLPLHSLTLIIRILLNCPSSTTATVQIGTHSATDKSDTDGSSTIKIVNPTSMKQ